MEERLLIKLAKESAILCMIHKYKEDRVAVMENKIELFQQYKSEFNSLYEKYFQLIIDIENE